jgi:hypothetical protein
VKVYSDADPGADVRADLIYLRGPGAAVVAICFRGPGAAEVAIVAATLLPRLYSHSSCLLLRDVQRFAVPW